MALFDSRIGRLFRGKPTPEAVPDAALPPLDPKHIEWTTVEETAGDTANEMFQHAEGSFQYGATRISYTIDRNVVRYHESGGQFDNTEYRFSLADDPQNISQELAVGLDARVSPHSETGSLYMRVLREGGRDKARAALPAEFGRRICVYFLDTVLPAYAELYQKDMVHAEKESREISDARKPLTHAEWMNIFAPMFRARGYTEPTSPDKPIWTKTYPYSGTGDAKPNEQQVPEMA